MPLVCFSITQSGVSILGQQRSSFGRLSVCVCVCVCGGGDMCVCVRACDACVGAVCVSERERRIEGQKESCRVDLYRHAVSWVPNSVHLLVLSPSFALQTASIPSQVTIATDRTPRTKEAEDMKRIM